MAQTKIKLIADGVVDENHLKAGHTITTDNIGEGTALYYTDARVASYLSTNSYATEGYVTTAVANLVDTAPSTLDTLNELAAALGDDPNFATTVTNSIATKLPLTGGTISGNLIVSGGIIRASDGTAATPSLQPGIDGDTGFFRPASNTIGFSTTGTERMRVDASGRVGIGASTFGSFDKVRITGTNAVANDLVLATPNTAQSRIFFSDTDAEGVGELGYDHASNAMRIVTNGSERLRIDSSGNVLIGNTAAIGGQPLFVVNPTSAEAVMGIQSTSASGYSAIDLYNNSGSAKGAFGYGNASVGATVVQDSVYMYSTTDLRFLSGGLNERMRIDSSGFLFVGTTTAYPGVSGLGGNIKGMMSEGGGTLFLSRVDGNPVLYVNRGGTDGDLIRFVKDTAEVGAIAVSATGASIRLGGNAAANALDDYEEGTWTPFLYLGFTSPTYSNTFGHYTKIGDRVYVDFRLELTSGTPDGNAIIIGGLPYISGGSGGTAAIGYLTASGAANYKPLLYVTGARLDFYTVGSPTPLTGSNFNDSQWVIHATATYKI